MTRTSRGPSLLRDFGAIAALYVDIFRLMEKRATGHGLIIRYTPPEDMPGVGREDLRQERRERQEAHTGR